MHEADLFGPCKAKGSEREKHIAAYLSEAKSWQSREGITHVSRETVEAIRDEVVGSLRTDEYYDEFVEEIFTRWLGPRPGTS